MRQRTARRARWAALAVAAIGLAALVSPVTAIADGPAAFSAQQPAVGGMVVDTPKPTIQVTATDPAGISTGNLTVDGIAYGTLYLDYPIGHWEDDGCDTWWVVDDYSVMVLRRVPWAATPVLGPGVHTAQVTVTNALGQVSTSSWTFTSEYRPVIVSAAPAAGSTVLVRQPEISVVVSDSTVDLIGAMTIDGAPVTPSFDSATKTFRYTPAPLEDGMFHTVSFTVTDEAGLTASRTWSFQVATSPDTHFRNHTPADGSVVSVLPVSLSVTADDPYSTFNSADTFNSIWLDGVARTTSRWYPVGHWEDDGCEVYWVVDDYSLMQMDTASVTLSDGVHTARAQVRTASAVTSETVWDFTVAVPPVASDFTPASGSTVTTPEIRARITDNGPGTPDATMTVNGAVVPATFNPSTGYLSYQVTTPLPNGAPTTVEIDMEDPSGNTSAASWSFMVDTASTATFSSWSPAPGSTITAATTMLSVYATSVNTLPMASARMWLDGRPVTVVPTQPSAYQVRGTYTAANMADGPHTVRFQVTDSLGFTSENSWSFTVMAVPAGGAFAPASSSVVDVPRPPIGLTISDNTPGPINVRITLNGVVVMNEPRPQGIVRWTPTTDLANGSINSVGVLLTDSVGLTRSYSWSFRVVAPAPMSDGTQCGYCHAASAHPFDNCGACHQTVGGYDPHGPSPAAPLGECGECHGYYPHNEYYITNCIYCHNGTWAQIPAPHSAAQLDPAHLSSPTMCTTCHDDALVALHGQYPEGTDFKYQCRTCHASTDAAVRAAIAAPDTRCTACHTTAHAGQHASGLIARCAECHDPNISSEHADACALCHESTDPTVMGAIAAGDLACETCHGFADHDILHEGGFSAGDGRCGECHSANISEEHLLNRGLTCDACHGVAAPVGVAAVTGTGPSRGAPSGGTVGIADAGMSPEDVWEAIASGDTSCDACHTSFHGDLLPSSAENTASPGYLSWSYVTSETAATGSPHGGYTANTNKCAVCHAVHRATVGGSVLTAYGPYASYEAGCIACHGPAATFTDVRVTADADGYISPHGTCSRCHALNPHGIGASAYPTLSALLLNTRPDAAVASDLLAGANGLLPAYFDGSTAGEATGTVLGTGYLCASCHLQSFAVNTAGSDPAGGGTATGHRVLAHATSAWDASAAGASMTATSTVAFADAFGCDSCHAATAADGTSAFPHGYVDAAGAVSPKTVAGSSYLWLTGGSFAGSADTTMLPTTEPDSPLLLTEDGLCLKCHRSAGGAGVGGSY